MRPTLVACCLAIAIAAAAQEHGAAKAVTVSQVLVTCDEVEDVSSIEAWKRSFIKPGMSDRDKAMAIWTTVVKFRHQDPQPNEFIEAMDVHDPIKCFNVYGYGICCCASGNVEELARSIGMRARGRSVGHSIPELFYDGGWHMLDASLIDWYRRPDGTPASVDEIAHAVDEWNAQRGGAMSDDQLVAFMRGGGWRKGPPLLATCTLFNENGWLPAGTHSWQAMMRYYGGKGTPDEYEYGTATGYRVDVQLRPGERLVRNWSNTGLYVNKGESDAPGCLTGKIGEGMLAYARAYGDLAPGRVGNGVHEWTVPLRAATLARVALACDGVADAANGVAAGAAKPGVVVLRVPTSYVFLGGEATLDAQPAAGGAIDVECSVDDGHSWTALKTIDAAGETAVPLAPLIVHRYEYRLRLTLRGAGTALRALKLREDVQHSQRALPALAKGRTTISFSAGDEGTITVFGRPDAVRDGRNASLADFAPKLERMAIEQLRPQGEGSATFAVETPGDMRRLRASLHYRARDAADGYIVEASFDAGATWKPVGSCTGPTTADTRAFTLDAPARARAALVRLTGHERVATCCFALRIDADYVEPAHGFAPIQVTYVWREGGKERRDVHVARSPKDTWTIACDDTPTMESLTVEQAP